MKSPIFTTNQPFSKWGEVFGDNVISSAIVDRIIHHCEIIKITGQSYCKKIEELFDELDVISISTGEGR